MHFTALPLSVALAVLPFLAATNGQSSLPSTTSSSGSSASQTLSGSSSSPSPSNTGGQPGGGGSTNFQLQEYLTFLNDSGYTSLSSAIEQANQTQNGQQWLTQLSDGNWTVFAPTNEAFSSVPQNVSSDPSTLADYLSYHYVYGDLHNLTASATACSNGSSSSAGPTSTVTGGGAGSQTSVDGGGSQTTSAPSTTNSVFALRHLLRRQDQSGQDASGNGNVEILSGIYPNDTVGRTTLSSPQLVRLEGDKNQVLAWTRFSPDGNVTILNQVAANNQNLTVANSTRWRNLVVAEVNGVFIPPGNISDALAAVGDQPFVQAASQVQLPGPDGSNVSALQAFEQAEGFTLFAPSSDAINDVEGQGLVVDPSQEASVLQNHYINGSTLYSPTLREAAANGTSGEGAYTSAGGQYFTFTTNDTGLFVSNGNGTEAQVVRSDVLLENGVVHLIDRVLFRTDSNAAVASSAYASASAAATESSTDTQAIIFPAVTGGATSGGPGGSETSTTQSTSDQSSSTQSTSTDSSSAQTTSTGSSTAPSTVATPSSFRIRGLRL